MMVSTTPVPICANCAMNMGQAMTIRERASARLILFLDDIRGQSD